MKKPNTFIDAIAEYEKITGETFFNDYHADGFVLKINDDNEFIVWKACEKDGIRYIWLGQCYGFISKFVPYLKDISLKYNLPYICTATTRNPKMHIRKWKMERLPQYDYDFEGRRYFVLKGDVRNLH